MDKNLSSLLKWSIEAQTRGEDAPDAPDAAPAGAGAGSSPRPLDPDVLNALLGGPSDAELMQASMSIITSADPSVTLDNKLTAFDNFEQLVESLDNANNMAGLALWSPLLSMLEHDEKAMRLHAAWCVGTAVQNNVKCQERLLAVGGIPKLVALATRKGEEHDVRRKAVYALSSATRNYQPALDVVTAELEKSGHRQEGQAKVDATNMDAVDEVMNGLKEQASKDAEKADA